MFPLYMLCCAFFLKNNPLLPSQAETWAGWWFFAILDPILLTLGRCATHASKHAKKPAMTSSKQIASGTDYEVTVLVASMPGAFKTMTTCTVIRSGADLVFYNPVFASPAEYKKCATPQTTRVQIVMGNKYHHMATDVILEAFPDAQITGSPHAAKRHPSITDKYTSVADAWKMTGFSLVDLSHIGHYFEVWVYFEPACLICSCDIMPGITAVQIEEGGKFWPISFLEPIVRLFDYGCNMCSPSNNHTTMAAYTKTTIADRGAMRTVVSKLLSKNKIKLCTGAHLMKEGCSAPGENFVKQFSWLLPPGFTALETDVNALQTAPVADSA